MGNTGFKSFATLEQYNVGTGVATGVTKPNSPSDPDYVPPVLDVTSCPPDADPVISINKVQLQIINSGSQFLNFGSIVIGAWNSTGPSQNLHNGIYSAVPGETKTILNPVVQQIGDWTNFSFANTTNSKLEKVVASVYFTNSTGRTHKGDVQIDVGGSAMLTLIPTPRTAVAGTNLIEVIFTDVPGDSPTPNTPPTAHAGDDQTIDLAVTNSVQLNGSGTDGDGTIASYNWSRVSGPVAYTISNPTIPNPVLSNLVEGIYEFRLTVTDDKGAIGTDTITITVQIDNNPDGLVIGFVDSTLTTSTISQIKLTKNGVVTNVLTTPVTSTNGPVVVTIPKGLYDMEVIVTGTGGSVKVNQGSNSYCQTFSGPGSYIFFDVTVDSGGNGLTVSLTGSGCGSAPSVYAKIELGATTHTEQALAPWGKEIIDSQVITAKFYSDAGATTPVNVSLVLNYRIANSDALTSTSYNTNTYTVLMAENSVVLGGVIHDQKWDYTLNDPDVQEPEDKIVDLTSTYSLLPGAGYIVIP